MLQEIIDTTISTTDSLYTIINNQHTIVKLIERPKTSLDYANDWAPIIIAILAFGFSVYQFCKEISRKKKERLEQKKKEKEDKKILIRQNKPLLNTFFSSHILPNYSTELFIINSGMGPARIKRFYYTYDGDNYDDFLSIIYSTDLQKCINDDKTRVFNSNNDFFIKPKSDIRLLKIDVLNNKFPDFVKIFNMIEVIIEYEDIFDNKQPNIIERFNHIEKSEKVINKAIMEYAIKNKDLPN